MTTKKELILRKYLVLTTELKKHLGENSNLLPPADDMDVADLIFFISMFFTGGGGGYRENIKSLIVANCLKVSDETFETVYPLVIEFIDFVKNMK
jgi:hypothetical protein